MRRDVWKKSRRLILAAVCLFLAGGALHAEASGAQNVPEETIPQETEALETETPESETILKDVRKAQEVSGKWVKKGKKYRFRRVDGTFAVNTWQKIKDKYYYFDENGIRVQGILKYQNGNTYYLDAKGAMVTGWQKIKKHEYYFKKNGAMKRSSWVKTRKKYYYVNAKGRKVKNRWIKVNGKKYYLDEDGARVTKSCYIGDKACYFDKNGVYHPGKKIKERLINPKKKMVALTFDDGPGPYTDRLLDCLKKNQSVATFFLVGRSIPNYKGTVKKMYELGCEIGNHTWDHPQLTSLSASGIQSQLDNTNSQIRAITGHNATLVRPPYGAYNSSVAANANAPLILWSIDTLDWKTRNAQNTINVVMNEVKDGSVILMHDIHSPSVDAAEILIPKLIDAGYQLVTVSELASYRGTTMRDGSAYHSF